MMRLQKIFSIVTFVVGSFLLLFLVFRQSFTTNDKLNTLTPNRNIDETSDDSDELKEQLKRQDERKQNVKDVCRNIIGNNTMFENGKIVKTNSALFLVDDINRTMIKFRLSPLYVDDQYKFLYCQIPKVACTNWKRIMLILTGQMNTTNPSELNSTDVHGVLQDRYTRSISQYTENEIRYRLKNYYKFMFVREPFERLLSAYRDKFVFNPNRDFFFHQTYGRSIIKQYRTSPSNESLETGGGVKFEEFVKYLLDQNTKYDDHWQFYHELCRPCFVQYDFIGKYETLKEDADLVMTQLGIQDLVKFPHSPNKRERTSEIVAREFENISEASFRRLLEIYSTDFSLFGYKYPSFKTDE